MGRGRTTSRRAFGSTAFGSDIVRLSLVGSGDEGTLSRLWVRHYRHVETYDWSQRIRSLVLCCLHRWILLSLVFSDGGLLDWSNLTSHDQVRRYLQDPFSKRRRSVTPATIVGDMAVA